MFVNTVKPAGATHGKRKVRRRPRGHEASAFLLGAAVEIEHLGSERFDVEKLLLRFDELGGVVLSCTSCPRLRKMDAPAVCPMSSMDDLARLTEESDRVRTFG